MISKKLKVIFLVSIPVFIAHGLEEYFTGFYNVDSHFKSTFGYLLTLPQDQALFLLFQIMFWFTLVISLILISSTKWQLHIMIIPGLIFIYELHHIYEAFMIGSYYPGLVTSIAFPVIGFLFWKEILSNYKNHA